MYEFAIYHEAERDLEALIAKEPGIAGEIVAFLEEVAGDQSLLRALSDEGFDNDRINVDLFRYMQRKGWNVWRLKLWSLEPHQRLLPYRIIYAFDGPRKVYHVIAIMNRDINYEEDTNFIKRCRDACEDLGLSQLPFHGGA